jgi:hypothetical protein
LTDEKFLVKAGQGWPNVAGYPRPSQLFPGLDPTLDQRLIRIGRDKDVSLCRMIAAIPQAEQREFLDLYLVDPTDAQHWARLPRWKRAVRHKANKDNEQIWKFFTMHRLNMELLDSGHGWNLREQGHQLQRVFGTLQHLTLKGLTKLIDVMSVYGQMLHAGQDVGSVLKKPWEE